MAFHQPQPHYGQCDSYFVEEDDEGVFAMRAEARERARAIGRMQQRALAEELSRLTSDEYQADIMKHMEEIEVRSTRVAYATSVLTPVPAPDPARCQLDRHPNGDPVVHASLPARLFGRSSLSLPATA